jgi:hypothetical protein
MYTPGCYGVSVVEASASRWRKAMFLEWCGADQPGIASVEGCDYGKNKQESATRRSRELAVNDGSELME